MRTELHALFSLDSKPLVDRDIRAMGFEPQTPILSGGYISPQNPPPEAQVAQVEICETSACAFLGVLDDRDQLAATLGFGKDARALLLANAVLERQGAAECGRLAGRWSLLRWNAVERSLELVGSDMAWQPIYVAADTHHVAISTDLRRLARLSWVDGRLDPCGLALALGRARLRRKSSAETIVRGILQLAPGGYMRVDGRGVRVAEPRRLPPAEPWSGTYEDGVAALEAQLRKVVRQHLERHPNTCLMLSGGLDSSLLAWFLATERRLGDTLTFVTSGASIGAGPGEKSGAAGIVADYLGIPLVSVRPSDATNIYIPNAGHFIGGGMPLPTLNHNLWDAFHAAAGSSGATSLMNGNHGELTVTNPLALTIPDRWRRDPIRSAVRTLRQYRDNRREVASWPLGAFHARLAPTLLGQLPGLLSDAWRAPFAGATPRPDQAWGYRKGSRLARSALTMVPSSDIETASPFLDVRILKLAAGMPAAFMAWQGKLRAPARRMLHGKLPEQILTRKDHLPFAPDYELRLQAQAPEALGRLDDFKASGLDEWLDLEWLERNLQHVARNGPLDITHAFEVHVTALAAEALSAWHRQPDTSLR